MQEPGPAPLGQRGETMKEWFLRKRQQLSDGLDERAPGSFFDWLWCMQYWWNKRPRRISCFTCAQSFWTNIEPEAVAYCSKECYDADYFSRELPF